MIGVGIDDLDGFVVGFGGVVGLVSLVLLLVNLCCAIFHYILYLAIVAVLGL